MTKRKKKTPNKIGKRIVKNDFEWKIYQQLTNLVPKNKVDYEQEKIPYSTSHTYLPDFKVITKSGKILYIEAKGGGRAWSYEVRNKMINVRDQNPHLDIRFVFYSDAPFGTKRKDGTKQKQSDWAFRNNFKFSIRDVPKEWLDE